MSTSRRSAAAYLLAEGCMVAAEITGTPEQAAKARLVLQQLLERDLGD